MVDEEYERAIQWVWEQVEKAFEANEDIFEALEKAAEAVAEQSRWKIDPDELISWVMEEHEPEFREMEEYWIEQEVALTEEKEVEELEAVVLPEEYWESEWEEETEKETEQYLEQEEESEEREFEEELEEVTPSERSG